MKRVIQQKIYDIFLLFMLFVAAAFMLPTKAAHAQSLAGQTKLKQVQMVKRAATAQPNSITIIVAAPVGVAPQSDWMFNESSSPFSIASTGGSQTFSSLKSDDYTFSETTKPGYGVTANCVDDDTGSTVTTGSSTVSFSLADGQSVSCTFTNTAQGSIHIVSQVIGMAPTSAWQFTWTGGAPFTLLNTGGTQDFLALTAGTTYGFTESALKGYTTDVDCGAGSTTTNSASITLQPGDDITCTFTNTALPGSIKVVTQDVGVLPATNWQFTGPLGAFTLKPGGDSQKLHLDAGKYSIAETVRAGYSVAVACDNNVSGMNSVSINLKPGQEVVCTFTNTSLPGTINVVNNVVGVTPATNWAFNGPNAPFTTQPNGGTQNFTVDAGSYTIAETAKPGYTTAVACSNGATGSTSVALTIGIGESVTCTFTNTAQSSVLTVIEQVNGAAPAAAWTFNGPAGTFTLPAGGGTQNITTAAGIYTVVETAKDGYATAVTCDNGAAGGTTVVVNLSAGAHVTCTFTSSAQPGSITVVKTIDGAVPADAWQFTGPSGAFSLAAAGGTTNFAGVVGTNTIVESAKPGYVTHVTCDNGAIGSNSVIVSLQPGQAVQCTFVSTTQPANLTITQQVNGSAPTNVWQLTGPNGPFTLAASGGTQTFALPAGNYAIAETAKSGYAGAVSCTNGTTGTNVATVALKPGDNVTCTFSATAQASTLTIVKVVENVVPDGDWQFNGPTGAFTIPALGGTQHFTPTAGTYQITQASKSGYTTLVACSNNATGSNSVTVELKPGENVTCTFTDTDRPAVIVVNANVTGDAPDSAWAFAGPNGPFSIVSTGGAQSFSVPAGSYALAETLKNGYSVKATCSNGVNGDDHITLTLNPGENVTCTFANTFVTSHPAITVQQTVGVNADACATTTTLSVTPNTPVYYCVTIKNTGDVALTQFVLATTQKANILRGQAGEDLLTLPVTLTPGQEIKVTNGYLASLKITGQMGPVVIAQETTTQLVVLATNVSMGASVAGSATASVSLNTATGNLAVYLPLINK